MLSYAVFTLTICGVYALLALSLNLIWGGVGLVNLGLAGFFAVGAYASAIATGAGAPVLIGWGAALAVGAVVGLVVTFATLRLRDDYLAIVTLGFAEVIRLIALNERWLTKGSDGISGIRAPLKAELGLQGFNLLFQADLFAKGELLECRLHDGTFWCNVGQVFQPVRFGQQDYVVLGL